MRKHSWNPYTSDIQRLSIYPRINTDTGEPQIKPGDELTLFIKDVDEKGNGIADYKNIKIVVYKASLGSMVKARIVRVSSNTAYAEVVETIRDSEVEY